jgi:hypothetical protein
MPEISKLPHPDREDIELTAVLFALSDDARLALVRELAAGPQDMVDWVVDSELRGRNRRLALRRADLDARFPGLLDAVLTANDRP